MGFVMCVHVCVYIIQYTYFKGGAVHVHEENFCFIYVGKSTLIEGKSTPVEGHVSIHGLEF